jgi:hypothetical protein
MIGSLDAAAALLLAAAGLAKLLSPMAAARMLSRAWQGLRRVPALSLLVRVGGLVEMLVGLAVVVVGGRLPATLLAGCYLVFTVVSVRLVLGRRRASCGCFGRADSPVGRPHVAVNVGFLGSAVAGIAQPAGPVADVYDAGPLAGSIAAGQIVLLAWLAFLSITALPALAADRRRLEEAR